MNKKQGMRSIWFLVGLIMFVIGIIVFSAGIYNLFNPTTRDLKLTGLHTNIWWGAVIIITGVVYIVTNRNKFVDM
ncbi:MAG: hypothetical protein WCA84_03540 [Ignavibacteriaceae bacterium]|jgi:uncharacterized membrane protein HdeD (DUF308 family)